MPADGPGEHNFLEVASLLHQIVNRIPTGRWGRPAGAAVFLASAASDYVNGHILVVDGAWLTR